MELTCDACGMPVAEEDAFCGECGESISREPETVAEVADAPVQQPAAHAGICRNCGSGLTAGERFCPSCGAQVIVTSVPPVPTPAPPVPPMQAQVPPQAVQGGQAPPATYNRGGAEVSERVKGTWENPVTRLPVVFLASMILGFILIADQTDIGLLYPLVLGGVIFVLLIIHATSPTSADGPILGAAGIALVLSVLGSLFGTGVLVALIASEGASFEFGETRDESVTVTLGALLALVGSVGLFLTTLRAYILDVVSRR